jgi:hypothetical protein
MDGKLKRQFDHIVSDTDAIFESFPVLRDLYLKSLERLKRTSGITEYKTQEVSKFISAIEQTAGTVQDKQEEINNKLYGQGLILLIGACESIIRDVFRELILHNIDKVPVEEVKNISFSFGEIKELRGTTTTVDWLGEMLLQKLEDERNPSEKLNFQNIQQMRGIFRKYLNLEFLNEDALKYLHMIWQIRHIMIHNLGKIDGKFLHNLEKVDKEAYEHYKKGIGKVIVVNEENYTRCKEQLGLFFEDLVQAIGRAGLEFENK